MNNCTEMLDIFHILLVYAHANEKIFSEAMPWQLTGHLACLEMTEELENAKDFWTSSEENFFFWLGGIYATVLGFQKRQK